MWLNTIEADRLRCLRAVRLDLPAGLTMLTGRNGQGKTSLLEAVYLLATGRSFRTRRLDELVAWSGGPLRVAGQVTRRTGRSQLGVGVDSGVRHLLADGLEQDLENYLGRIDVVDLTAERMGVVRGAPLERRRFLDRGILGLQPSYLRELADYRRVLQQRNALLRDRGRARSRAAELDVWDERLVRAGCPVHTRRRRYAISLATRLGPMDQDLRLRYLPSPGETRDADPAEFAKLFGERLARGRARDLDLGSTSAGPHRDELVVELSGVDLRKFGSAGQVRASMIALKLGKLSILREERGEAPLFLMDDFDTDLDEARASAVAQFLREGEFQAVVATSKEAMIDRLGVDFEKVQMEGGAARAE